MKAISIIFKNKQIYIYIFARKSKMWDCMCPWSGRKELKQTEIPYFYCAPSR